MVTSEKSQSTLPFAVQVFRAKRYHGTTTNEIADAAGVPERTEFRLVRKKHDALGALVHGLDTSVAPQLFDRMVLDFGCQNSGLIGAPLATIENLFVELIHHGMRGASE